MTYRQRFAKARRVAKTMRDKGVTRARVRAWCRYMREALAGMTLIPYRDFPDKYLRGVVELAEQDIGLHYSRPGLLMLMLEYEDAACTWDLTIGELAEGRRIALDDAVDAPDMFDDLLQ